MFEYENLPKTIPAWVVERLEQFNGHLTVAEHENNLYVFNGALGGQPDVYYMPTKSIVANPALNLSKEFTIGENCVVIPNDTYYTGLLPLFSKYATQLVENDISIYDSDINARIIALISAGTDKSMKAAIKYLEDVKSGKLGVIADSSFIEGLKSQPYGNGSATNGLTSLIELHQYLKASLWNEVGLRDNYNMKREAINGSEAALNDDILLPLADNMLKCRQDGWNKVNEMFGTDVKVRLSSAWEDRQIERNMSVLVMEENSFNNGNALEEEIIKETLEETAEDIGVDENVVEEAAKEMLNENEEVRDETLQKD